MLVHARKVGSACGGGAGAGSWSRSVEELVETDWRYMRGDASPCFKRPSLCTCRPVHHAHHLSTTRQKLHSNANNAEMLATEGI